MNREQGMEMPGQQYRDERRGVSLEEFRAWRGPLRWQASPWTVLYLQLCLQFPCTLDIDANKTKRVLKIKKIQNVNVIPSSRKKKLRLKQVT